MNYYLAMFLSLTVCLMFFVIIFAAVLFAGIIGIWWIFLCVLIIGIPLAVTVIAFLFDKIWDCVDDSE